MKSEWSARIAASLLRHKATKARRTQVKGFARLAPLKLGLFLRVHHEEGDASQLTWLVSTSRMHGCFNSC